MFLNILFSVLKIKYKWHGIVWCWIQLIDIHIARHWTSLNSAHAPEIEAVFSPLALNCFNPHKSFPRSSITGWSVAYVWLDSPCSAPCGSCSSPTPRTPGAPPPPGKQQSKQSARTQTKTNLCLFRGPHVGIAEAPGGRLTGNHSNKHHLPEHQTQHTLHTVSLQIGLKGPKRTKQDESDGGPLFRQLLLIMSLCIIKTN